MKIDGSSVNILDSGQPFGVHEDWVYYQQIIDWQTKQINWYRIRSDGSSKQLIAQFSGEENYRCFSPNISGNWIYNIDGGINGGSIYKMNLAGSSNIKIIDGKCKDISIFDNNIYYFINDEIYKADLDGTNNEKLIN